MKNLFTAALAALLLFGGIASAQVIWPIVSCSTAPTKQFTFLSGNIDPAITFTRSGTAASEFNSVGTLVTGIAANTLREDYNPTSLALNGLLLEQATSNTLFYSEDDTRLTSLNGTSALGVTAPDGSAHGNTYTEASTGSQHSIYEVDNTTTSGTATVSRFFKAGGTRRYVMVGADYGGNDFFIVVDTVNWTVTHGVSGTATYISSPQPQSVGNGWYRVSVTGAIPGATSYTYVVTASDVSNPSSLAYSFTGNGSTIITWGSGITTEPFATSYISTNASQATRNIDSAKVTTIPWFNASDGTIYVEAMVEGINTARNTTLASFNDGTANNQIKIILNTSGVPQAQIIIAGTAYTSGGSLSPAIPGSVIHAAIGYNPGANSFVVNGTADTAGTFGAAALPTTTQLTFGDDGAQAQTLNGWMRALKYWNTLQPQASLVQMTMTDLYTVRNYAALAVSQCQALNPTATDCQNTLVTHTVPGGCSGPAVINSGGTYSGGCYQSTSASQCALTINTTSPVTITGNTLVGPGDLICSTNSGSIINGTVTGNMAWGAGTYSGGPGRFIFAAAPSGGSLTVTNNRFSNLWGMSIQGQTQTSSATVTVNNNLGFNMTGGLSGGYTLAHGLQIKNGIFPAAQVENNVFVDQPGVSSVNDVINLYLAGATTGNPMTVSGNKILGAYPNPITGGFSGCGIITDGAGTSSTVTQFVNLSGNVIIGTTNGGDCLEYGHDNVANGDILVSSGLANSTPLLAGAQNVSIIIQDEGAQGSGIYFNNNALNVQFYWLHASPADSLYLFNNTTTWTGCEAGGCGASNGGYAGSTPFAHSTINQGYYLESLAVQTYFPGNY